MDCFSDISNGSKRKGFHFYIENNQKLLHLGSFSIILLISDQLLNVSMMQVWVHTCTYLLHVMLPRHCTFDLLMRTLTHSSDQIVVPQDIARISMIVAYPRSPKAKPRPRSIRTPDNIAYRSESQTLSSCVRQIPVFAKFSSTGA